MASRISITANSHANDRVEAFEATTYRQANAVFHNANGRFENVSSRAGPDFAVARAHRGIGVGDFDGDGRLDVVVTVLGDRPQLLHNVSSAANGWLTLRLIGQASNRQGIGTVIHVGSQTDQMTTSVGYASSSDYGVHFGLGTAADGRSDRAVMAERREAGARSRDGESRADRYRAEVSE